MHDRYLEHVQPALFVARHYNRCTIVLNDIGAVSYYADSRVLDMYGLSSLEPVAFRRQAGGYTKDDVGQWSQSASARIAILQVEWDQISPRIPDAWVKIAEWHIPRNVVFGDTRIGFFAVDAREAHAWPRTSKPSRRSFPAGSRRLLSPPRIERQGRAGHDSRTKHGFVLRGLICNQSAFPTSVLSAT